VKLIPDIDNAVCGHVIPLASVESFLVVVIRVFVPDLAIVAARQTQHSGFAGRPAFAVGALNKFSWHQILLWPVLDTLPTLAPLRLGVLEPTHGALFALTNPHPVAPETPSLAQARFGFLVSVQAH
jgi:hypothetical protein